MTEAEWLACVEPQPMLEFLRGKASERKLRLFACACCRRVWPLMEDERSRMAVDVAEGFADGLVSESERAATEDATPEKSDAGRIQFASWAAISAITNEPPSEDTYGFHWEAHRVGRGYSSAVRSSDYAAKAIASSHQGKHADKERNGQCVAVRCIFGNPFRPVTLDAQHLTAPVASLALAIYNDRAFDRMPILADALEDAGCPDAAILDHCRGPGPHVRGCWVVDLLTGRE